MLGQSGGPVIGGRAETMVRNALTGCQRLMVREDLSAKLMEKMGLKQITVLAPDMAFLTVPRSAESYFAGNYPVRAGVMAWRNGLLLGIFQALTRNPSELRMSKRTTQCL